MMCVKVNLSTNIKQYHQIDKDIWHVSQTTWKKAMPLCTVLRILSCFCPVSLQESLVTDHETTFYVVLIVFIVPLLNSLIYLFCKVVTLYHILRIAII